MKKTNVNATASLFDLIEDMDNAPRIAALRGIVHSSMAKCIGAIRQHIRDMKRIERNAEEGVEEPQIDLDRRNDLDESIRSVEEINKAMGFNSQIPAITQAAQLHAVYDWANSELMTLITSKWDAPLSLEDMLAFMTNNAQKLDEHLAQALADAAKTDVKTIERMHDIQNQREKEQLIEATPEIIATFNGFGENGHVGSIEELPKITQHQMGVKVVESLNKARDQVLSRVMRTRRISELGAVPILEDAAKTVSDWVEAFEKRYSDEIDEAINLGRNVRTLDDVATI